jgi:hypothetical protein
MKPNSNSIFNPEKQKLELDTFVVEWSGVRWGRNKNRKTQRASQAL